MARFPRYSFTYAILLVAVSLMFVGCKGSESQVTQSEQIIVVHKPPSPTIAAVTPVPSEEFSELKTSSKPSRTIEPFFDDLPSGLLALEMSEDGLVIRELNGDVVGKIQHYSSESASISPDGKSLVVRCMSIDCLQIVKLEDMSVEVIAKDSELWFDQVSWASDNLVLYVSAEEKIQESGEDWGSIFRVDLESGETIELTHWWTAEIAPAVSPDRKWLAYSADFHHDHPGEDDLYLYDLSCADDPEACFQLSKRLTFLSPDGHATSPSWDPASQKIVYVCRDGSIHGLCILDIDSGITKQIYTSSIDIRDPYWSPDGERILFRVLKTFNHELIVIRPDGTDENLLSDKGSVRPIGWILRE